jgi:hypothetical protein
MADARTIALVGASGRTSSHVLSALLALPSAPHVRAIVRGTSSADKLRAAHATLDVTAVGDYLASAGGALDRALAGARVVWYNAPAFTPYAGAGAVAVVDAAIRAGAQHFVFCGVLDPLLTKLINHKDKLPCVRVRARVRMLMVLQDRRVYHRERDAVHHPTADVLHGEHSRNTS